MLHFPYFQRYRKQVVKQADLVLAMHLRGDAFTCEQKARNFGYYERLTVRDSSLSACTQAVIAAEVGHLGLAYDYFAETTLIDLKDLQRNTRGGLHIASLAGAWTAAVAGFGGMRDHGGTLTFAPRLPQRLTRLTFRLCYRQRCIEVAVSRHHAAYKLVYGEPLATSHHGQPVTISPGKTLRRPIPAAPIREPPTHPASRPRARPAVAAARDADYGMGWGEARATPSTRRAERQPG
jgi:alpha,alpha-trehalose phosphorylase